MFETIQGDFCLGTPSCVAQSYRNKIYLTFLKFQIVAAETEDLDIVDMAEIVEMVETVETLQTSIPLTMERLTLV